MTDFYPISKKLAEYVYEVIAHLSLQAGEERASLRTLERLQVVLQAGFEGMRADDVAFVLMRPEQEV
ncbi:hypothetical protein ACVILK_006844 [Bradyrhizobium embrapense]